MSGFVQIPSLPNQFQSASPFTWMTAVSVFIVAFPCALKLAAPTSMVFGLVPMSPQETKKRSLGEQRCLRQNGTITSGLPKVTDFKILLDNVEDAKTVLSSLIETWGLFFEKSRG